MLDPLRFSIAAVPLASYLLLIGWIGLRRVPTLVRGTNDLATLAGGLTGLALVGPIALFRPEAASAQLGNTIWLFLLVFYWLWVTLGVMLSRPRLVIYNVTADEARPALAEAIGQIDNAARWAGNSLLLPSVGVQLHLDSQPWMRNVSLIASGGAQNLAGWQRLSRALGRSLRSVEVPPSPRGGPLLVAGLLLLALSMIGMVSDPEGVRIAWMQLSNF